MVSSTVEAKFSEVGQDARSRLREAALVRLGRQGVRETSTREIVAAAGFRNPSAISYYFGSKAALIEDLLLEVNREQSAIIQQHVALAARSPRPSPSDWAAVAVDSATGMLGTERGCLLVRVWAENDEAHPDAVEEFLAGGHPLAGAWRDAVAATFPDLPAMVAIARNVVALRTLQWLTVRRARRILSGRQPSWNTDPTATRGFTVELMLNILTPATAITDEQLLGG